MACNFLPVVVFFIEEKYHQVNLTKKRDQDVPSNRPLDVYMQEILHVQCISVAFNSMTETILGQFEFCAKTLSNFVKATSSLPAASSQIASKNSKKYV